MDEHEHAAAVAHLGVCRTAVVYDVLRGLGLTGQALPAELRPLDPTCHIAGAAFPVSGRPDEHITADESLRRWTRLLSRAPAGSVVVCQPHDHTVAHMGELSAAALQHRGVRGYVVDGGCRDTALVTEYGFPVWCRYVTPEDIVGRWRCEDPGVAVRVGEVAVHPGDVVVADRDGVVIVPGERATEVAELATDVSATESALRRAIRAGTDPEAAYEEYGTF